MIHRILPGDAESGETWVSVEISLGGCFYDHLLAPEGEVVGVRYWIIDRVDFSSHPVFRLFLDDERFSYSQSADYVDIVFCDGYANLLRDCLLTVDDAQEFGGESVVRSGDRFGIVFSLARGIGVKSCLASSQKDAGST